MTNSNNKNMEDYNKKDVKFTEGLKPMTASSEYDGDTLNTFSPVYRKKKGSILDRVTNTLNQYVSTDSHQDESAREILMTIGQNASQADNPKWKGFYVVIVIMPNGTKFVARNRYGKSGIFISEGELIHMVRDIKDNILITPFEKAVGKSK